MDLLSPDILKEARELSPALPAAGLFLGAVLWFVGARSHRFWVALVITVSAGVYGLVNGAELGMNPLAAGLLLAVAAGALALSLVRLMVFAAGALAALAVAHLAAPHFDEPIACALVGGLVGIVFYRLWITALTSLVGTLLIAYSGLCLADKLARFDSLGFVRQHAPLLNWAVAAVTLLGILAQYLVERRRVRLEREEKDKAEKRRLDVEERARRAVAPAASWWAWGGKKRKAG